MSSSDTDRIRALNDDLRRHLYNGGVFLTPGIAALGEEAIGRLANAIATFDDFCTANDPHREHDFGAFDFTVHPSCLKSIITTRTETFTRWIQPIHQSPSA